MPEHGRARRGIWMRWFAPAMLGLAVCGAVRTSSFAQAPPAASVTDPERARALDALFKGLKAAHGDDEADELVARIWETWTRSGRPDVDRLMEEGIGLLSIHQLGAAHDRFTQAIEVAPDFAEAWNKRATVLFLMQKHEQSLADIEKVLALEPRHFGALAGRGMIHAHAGRWHEALEAYSQALAINPYLKERESIIPELERRAGEKPL